MTKLSIIIGNKNYSSWSLRAWAALKLTGLDFEEKVIPLDLPDTKRQLLAASPSARVPVLLWDDLVIWDTMAIGEFLAERCPDAGLWPADMAARARARSVSAEMHSGFAALRDRLPMDLSRTYPIPEMDGDLERDIARICEIWRDCRSNYGQGGDFLFGRLSLADAMFLPVATRFASYGIALDDKSAAYRDALLTWPPYVEWRQAAEAEPWVIESP